MSHENAGANVPAGPPSGQVFESPPWWQFLLKITWATRSTKFKMVAIVQESKSSWCGIHHITHCADWS